MTDLPKPTVTTTHDLETDESGRRYLDVTISREEGKGKTYRGIGHSIGTVVEEVVKQIINDPHSAEWLPEKAKS